MSATRAGDRRFQGLGRAAADGSAGADVADEGPGARVNRVVGEGHVEPLVEVAHHVCADGRVGYLGHSPYAHGALRGAEPADAFVDDLLGDLERALDVADRVAGALGGGVLECGGCVRLPVDLSHFAVWPQTCSSRHSGPDQEAFAWPRADAEQVTCWTGPLPCPITDRYFRPVSSRTARAGSRAACRRAAAMPAWPARRRMPMTRLPIAAVTCGPVPVRAVKASSPLGDAADPVQAVIDLLVAADPGGELAGPGRRAAM